MKTMIYRDETGFDALALEWDVLLHDSQADTVFMTHMWQTTWWRHLGEGDLRILAVRDEQDVLLGLAPLFRVPHNEHNEIEGRAVLSTVGCVDVSDYLDWIARRGQEEPVFEALLEALDGTLADEWKTLALCNIPEDSPTLEWVPRLARARGWQVTQTIENKVPVFQVPASWEAYEELLEGKARREMRRKLRKAGPHNGVEWYILGPEHDLQVEVDAFIALLVKSHPEKADFMDARNRAFFQSIARATLEGGQLQLAFLTLNEERIAAYMNFIYNRRVMVYNSGLDPAAYKLSPGIVLLAHLIRQAIEDEREIFDFLRGDESYKYDLGGRDTHVCRLTVVRG
jgi:CelD/BcsL family acetyltransferase involved in cellulose biosynthesis